MSLKLGELFSGYGGLGLAVEEALGAELAWYAEYEAAPSKIMAHHWPALTNYGDVTKVDWSSVPPVDIISGGSPCQDLSLAGKRRGMQDGTRSNLWESMREAIAIIKPTYVVWENVRGALSAGAVSEMEQSEGRMGADGNPNLRALGRVLGDLADLGFDAEWRGIRASDVGAPHGRFLVFVLAANRDHLGKHGRGPQPLEAGWGKPANHREVPAHSNHQGSQGQHHQAGTAQAERHGHTSAGVDWREYAGAVRRWEAVHGAAPAPVELGPTGKPRLSARFAEWMMGLPAGWVTEVPSVGWGDQLKACGNGVVPAQAAAALADMLTSFESLEVAA